MAIFHAEVHAIERCTHLEQRVPKEGIACMSDSQGSKETGMFGLGKKYLKTK